MPFTCEINLNCNESMKTNGIKDIYNKEYINKYILHVLGFDNVWAEMVSETNLQASRHYKGYSQLMLLIVTYGEENQIFLEYCRSDKGC